MPILFKKKPKPNTLFIIKYVYIIYVLIIYYIILELLLNNM